MESTAQPDAPPDEQSAAPVRPAGPGWPRRAALRAAAGLGLALPLSTAACGTSAAKSGPAGQAGGTKAATAKGGSPSARASTNAHATTRPSAGPSASATVRATSPAGPAVEVMRGVPETDAVALTFHGGGTPALADALLAEAERADIRVTVMAVGSWLNAYPQMAKRVLDGGHELGNHTQRHMNINIMSPFAAYTEIATCAATLRRLTGSQGRWFRPSQAQHATAQVRAAAARAGYRDVLSYDVDPRDYTDPGSAAVVRNVLGVIAPGDVVSMHLGHRGTVEALPAILDGLLAKGLRAITADALFPVPAAPSGPAVPSQEAGQQ